MLRSTLALLSVLVAAAPSASAEAPQPGSVLIFPFHRSTTAFTLVNVTNTNTDFGGDVRAVYQYVNATPQGEGPSLYSSCTRVYRLETLTPGDTVSVMTRCHDVPDQEGYLVVSAKNLQGVSSAHDHLVGSVLVIDASGAIFSMLPYSFRAAVPAGAPTDVDFDGFMDFDGVEYEPLPGKLLLDSFVGVTGTRLVLLHLTPQTTSNVHVRMDVFNDNEVPLSLNFSFRCWFQMRLSDLSGLFTQAFLAGTPNDPGEVDIDCDGVDDFETGWIRIDAITTTAGVGAVDPGILGAMIPSGPGSAEGGRILWGKGATTGAEF